MAVHSYIDKTNAIGSPTVSIGTNWNAFPMIENYLSNAISEIHTNTLCLCQIDRVIFNDPATIVIWKDKTKTVVKCHNEPFDREKGLAMCIAKKVLGKDFHKTFREWNERKMSDATKG